MAPFYVFKGIRYKNSLAWNNAEKRSVRMKIKEVYAREVLDSRGDPTVEATVILESGAKGVSKVPSGASVGKYEAHEKRDGDKSRYLGKGVLGAVGAVNGNIRESIVGMTADQQLIDKKLIELDGTESKERLGANAILAVSIAIARASASHLGIPLYSYVGGCFTGDIPSPMLNIINGGAHASNNLEIQEFMIIPTKDIPFSEKLRKSVEIYKTLGKILKGDGLSTALGDEGGYAPYLDSDEDALRLITKAINEAGYGDEFKLGLDVAASEWWTNGEYRMTKSKRRISKERMCEYYLELADKYPIASIEDGMGEDDPEGWEMMTRMLGKSVMLIGDDLFVTSTKRLQVGIRKGLGNGVLVKPNQIGTLTETVELIRLAKKNGYTTVMSHRSGETEDAFISDLAVGLGTPYIKAGAPTRSERVAKYNRLAQIHNT